MSTIADASIETIDPQTTVPRILDPGAAGWADEPKVTAAERQLFGDLAGAVRLLGQAAVASQDAYSLTCKHSHDVYSAPSPESDASDEAITATWALYELAAATHRQIAERAVSLQRLFAERRYKSQDSDEGTSQLT